MTNHRRPEDCESLAQVREQIDRLDDDIVALLAERGRYVLAAAPFKHSADEVRAPQRVEQVLAKVRQRAMDHGGMPEVVERIYRELIDAFIDAEHQRWQQR